MNGRRKFTKLAAVAVVTSLAFLASCEEDQATDPTAIATGATAAAKGGNGNGGGNGGGGGGGGSTTTADPVITLPTLYLEEATGPTPTFTTRVTVMNGDGSNRTLLAIGTLPAWAPGGAGTVSDPYRISYWDTADSLTIIDVAVIENTPQVVDSISHPFPSSRDPAAWSPLGNEIAFTDMLNSPGAVLIMQVSDGSVHTVYQALSNHIVSGPTWSPDGEYLVFEDADGLFAARDVFKVLHLETRNLVTLDLGTTVSQDLVLPDWAKTKPAIAFGALPSKGKSTYYIYVVDLEPDGNGNWQTAGPPVRLARGVFPSWSSHDSEIVFSNNDEIMIYAFATDRTGRLGFGSLPDWRR